MVLVSNGREGVLSKGARERSARLESERRREKDPTLAKPARMGHPKTFSVVKAGPPAFEWLGVETSFYLN